MKKILLIIVLIALLLAVSGCLQAKEKSKSEEVTDEDIAELEELQKDAESSELNGLEEDLEDINW